MPSEIKKNTNEGIEPQNNIKECIIIQKWWRSIKKLEEDKKINIWIKNRTKNKKNIDILPKNVLLSRYKIFADYVRKFLLLEQQIGHFIGRIPNFPDYISENIVLYVLRYLDRKCSWDCKGDIIVITGDSNTQGEVKCHFNGPSQFSPKKNIDGDTLFYLEAKNHIYNGVFELYELKNYSEDLKNVKINKNSSLEEQQDSGRRPRFDIIKTWGDKLEDKLIWKGSIYDLLK